MPEITDIFRDWHEDYPYPMTGAQYRAVNDILKCRTPEMEYGTVYTCPGCGNIHFTWQSCGNRNCPKCGHEKIIKWLADRKKDILPVNYFMITFALPAELRQLCRLNPRKVYNIFFKTAAGAMTELALDKRFLGGKIGSMGTLQTWRRDGEFHPHIHFLVPGGGLSQDGEYWLYPKKRDFLIPAKPLAKLFRNKFRTALTKQELNNAIPESAWGKNWVVDVENVGNGMSSFKYLAPYMQRGFISNNRIEKYDGEFVTFRYTDGQSHETKYRTLHAIDFLVLYLQHVLPTGFMKTRYYGLLGAANKKTIRELKLLILSSRNQALPELEEESFEPKAKRCGKCGQEMKILHPHIRPPPGMK